ncbi:MAG: GIY-YIG nuclease family protein [Bacteroidetes bacterium]|nr:GIY-YIG nuclease family protein [Bacteroidota bacterium]
MADKYYVGYSSDPWRRLHQHLNNDGTKFTGSFKDWKISAIFQASTNITETMKIERFIKRQKSRKLIERMLEAGVTGTGVLAQLVRVPHVRD